MDLCLGKSPIVFLTAKFATSRQYVEAYQKR